MHARSRRPEPRHGAHVPAARTTGPGRAPASTRDRSRAPPVAGCRPASGAHATLVELQRTVGNHGVGALVDEWHGSVDVLRQAESHAPPPVPLGVVRRVTDRIDEIASVTQAIIARFVSGELVSRRPIVTWTGGTVAKQRAARMAERLRGYTLEMTWYGRLLDSLASSGTRIPHALWRSVSMWFAFVAGLRKQPLSSVMRIPVRTGAIRESELRAHRVGTSTGTALRGAIRVSGGIGVLSLAEDLESIRSNRTQVDLEGLSPKDFPVGHVFENVYLGSAAGGVVYVDIRVERNVVFRRKFYIVAVRVLA
jgi:hypothetical protein